MKNDFIASGVVFIIAILVGFFGVMFSDGYGAIAFIFLAMIIAGISLLYLILALVNLKFGYVLQWWKYVLFFPIIVGLIIGVWTIAWGGSLS